jgi:proteasome lid subunit RPN8/RPN11
VLIGKDTEVVQAVRTRNLADSPTRFLIDPKDHIAARRTGRSRGLDVVGFYHSHPHSAPEPSPMDLAEATYAGHLYLIVGLIEGRADVRVFRLEGGRFVELEFVSAADR